MIRKQTPRDMKRRRGFRSPFPAALLLTVTAWIVCDSAYPQVLKSFPGQQPRQEYRARRLKLMEKYKDGIIVLLGAREDDVGDAGRFRQNNNFMYLTGVEVPDAYLILIPAGVFQGAAVREILFLPPRNPSEEAWTGEQIEPGAQAILPFGVREVESSDKFYSRLFDMLLAPPFKVERPGEQTPPKLYLITPRGPTAQLTREAQFIDVIVRTAPRVMISNINAQLAEMRKVKSQPEMAVIQKAIEITASGLRAASATIKPGAYEYEVQGDLESVFLKSGSERTAFPSIIGSGANSAIVHYNQNRKMIEGGDLVVVDVGAEYGYYAGDLSRTFPASGKFTSRQREIYQLVLDAQRAAERAFSPGMITMKQLERVVIDFMKASPVRDKHGNTVERYFIHSIGHWLGMNVHDPGDYSKPIPVGAIFTIEPGVYLQDEKLGIRIEDDYLATESGLVKLSRSLPSEPDEVEKMVAAGKAAASEKPRTSTGARATQKR
jgi:Xaa-Pro aminopeptidase